MLDIFKEDARDTKFYFTHSLLPGYIDPQNVSTKKKPFSTFNGQRFSHTLDLILPEEIYELVHAQLEAEDGVARGQYARVYMKLGELLDGEFFTEYIKKGNIIMLSEGRPLIDNVFSLCDGVLRLELDRPTYERCGLQGTPIEDGGRKHQKGRWVVEFDLRSPSMVHGKKGFSRLEWACKNVLDQSLTWLFYNLNPSSKEALAEGKEPISKHHPSIQSITPSTNTLKQVLVPKIDVSDLPTLHSSEESLSILEYLNLLSLASPRLNASDDINPYLSRYEVPDFGKGLRKKNMVQVRWKGLIPPQFIRSLFLTIKHEGLKVEEKQHDGGGGTSSKEEERWFAMSAGAFGGAKSWTVMQWAGRETLTWECGA
ncbi:hypothetical protein BS50DRAFT_568403 [Corynespora cassiicola Philippines]|uniref:Uncharacterized protein n=1 Tax=Corynespora cassiicola Philippines TaxID=1448308 RepID=A0A2T2P547_CORCC|nr:hypothetical protein BS50DRAFT_568403 [Corynespora cassiicola Philippines]